MPGSSVYQQNKHRQFVGGLLRAQRAAKCYNCDGLAPAADIFKGWCPKCLAAWGSTADQTALAVAREVYSQRNEFIRAEPPTARAYERLKDRIAERRPDDWFIPMTLYVGNYTIGQAQANWNYLQAMYELEVMTTGQAFKIGKESHDLLHVCGRHAPMQQMSLAAFIGRVINSPDVWRDVEPRMQEYIRDFIAQQGGNFAILTTERRRIDAIAKLGVRTRRAYRIDPNRKTRAQVKQEKAAWEEKFGEPLPTVPSFWPFAVRQAPDEHTMLQEIDRLTRGVPEQWRQDVCQDLVVAVLSGEVTLPNLKDAVKEHIGRVFKMHPIKYGDVSLDAPIHGDGTRTLAELLAYVPQEDTDESEHQYPHHNSHELARGGWHEGFDRPVGISRIGDILREKHGGIAIE